jgi:hypothetical protein
MGPWHASPAFIFVWYEPLTLNNTMTPRRSASDTADQETLRWTRARYFIT